jgi:Histidine kinase-like ATPase domain
MNGSRYLGSDGAVNVGPATLTLHRAHHAPPAPTADDTDYWWLMLAAEMAGLVRGNWGPLPDFLPTDRWDLPRLATFTPGTDVGSVRAARDFVLATLRRWDWADHGEDITIVVAELLTNALRHALPEPGSAHARRPIQLGLLQPGPYVLCAVADPSTAAPVPQAPGSLAETGRGLQIIRALSDGWGYTVLSDAGKVVWATFALEPARPPAQFPEQARKPHLTRRASRSGPSMVRHK